MKIKIEHYDEVYSFETKHDDLGLPELHDIWERCLMAMTFSPDTIKEFYKE